MSTASQYSHFDLNHWLAVKQERLRQGLPNHPERGSLQPNHPLLGTTVVDNATGRSFLVERVRKDWLQGWFLTAILNCNGSHAVAIVGIQGCVNPGIVKQFDQFQANFRTQH